MPYDDLFWKDIDPENIYDTVEDVLLTCCHVCGERLEWTLSVKYSPYLDLPIICGESTSCGIIYRFTFDHKKNAYVVAME